MKEVYNIHTDNHVTYNELMKNNKVFEFIYYSIHSNEKTPINFMGCFTKERMHDIFFIKSENKNYIALCERNYVYGNIESWTIDKIFEVEKNEGNQIYLEIKKSKFISKKGKTFFKTNRF